MAIAAAIILPSKVTLTEAINRVSTLTSCTEAINRVSTLTSCTDAINRVS